MSYWYVLQLRDRSSKQNSRKQLYQRLKKHYGKCSQDIYLSLTDVNFGLNHYLFLYETDMQTLWKDLRKQKYFNIQFGYQNISDEQMSKLKEGVQFIREQIGFGDVVKVKTGKFNNLNGIVLRERKGSNYQIGLKFCYGVVTDIKPAHQLQIIDNLFKYIKIPK